MPGRPHSVPSYEGWRQARKFGLRGEDAYEAAWADETFPPPPREPKPWPEDEESPFPAVPDLTDGSPKDDIHKSFNAAQQAAMQIIRDSFQ